ncbi:hypothetical protein RhiirA4_440329 [Rhizophagus irregularis]|uniref:Uncharacterized protein n=1 Tax=Rhizophagus irregularis TaxID=588596 RepID=A0A2I1FZT7_9GLOM|nr:hypothetical protein RhiirA4_440329 [Rhizophagus irregularis]
MRVPQNLLLHGKTMIRILIRILYWRLEESMLSGVVIFLIIGGFRVNLGQYDVINAKEVEAKELVDELTPSLENIAYSTADDADDADGIFNADNTNDDNCDDADDKKNSDEDEEILYDFFDLFLEGVELANEDFETYKSLV